MYKKFKLNAITTVVVASCLSQPLWAQEAPKESDEELVERAVTKDEESDIEVIEVQGIKGSLQKSVNSKRFNDSVSDSIHAEDVGKSTDQNIADALSRVTGVTVQEEAGEGTRISVRGAGPSLNQVSINGVALTGGLSGGGGNGVNNNSVDLSSFSADILSSIDVVKTAAADQDEGSLGANIELKTVRPLSLNKPRRSFTVEGRHNEFADDEDYRIVGSFSEKLFNDRLGFIITATKDRQNTRVDRIDTDWANQAIQIADALDEGSRARPATDLATGQPIRVLGYQRDNSGELILGEDGQPLLNPIESLLNYDPATQTLVEGDLFVMGREFINYNLNTDQRDRLSISTGIQYEVSDDTMLQVDITHTNQKVLTDNHRMFMNIAPLTPLIHPDDNNVALNVVDLSTNTLQRSTSRSITGGFNRARGLRELTTNVVTLDLFHSFTDDLTMNLRAGYSGSEDETPDRADPDAFFTIGTATWGTAGRNVVEAMPSDILELVGYDCTQGSLSDCEYFTGSTPGEFDAFDGSANSVTSRFNPFDLQHNHLGNLAFRENKFEDTNKSLFIDFDYALDNDYVTSIEFGGKYAHRNRDVSIKNTAITNGEDLIALDDPDAEFEVRGLASIRVANMLSGEAFPYDNYGEDLQANRDNAFWGGWPLLDAQKALELLSGKDASEVGVRFSDQGTREITTETMAAYFKANFEFMDGRLTGNIGVRYVKDENEASGIGGINYIRAPQVIDPYNLFVERDLGNTSLDPCPLGIPIANGDTRYAPQNEAELSNCWAWALTHGYNFNNAATIPFDVNTGQFLVVGPDGQTGLDVNRLVFQDENGNFVFNELPGQVYDSNGNLVPTNASSWARFNQTGYVWPFLDRSTSFTGPNGTGQEVQVRTAPVTDDASSSIWLPSLTLNYALNEETIVRFALTKTMTRPRFDSLNPSAFIRENQFGLASGNAGNTALKPLTSNNIDLSYEWYFSDSGLLSAAFFYKDMDNFEETVVTPFHYRDVREEVDLQDSDLLLDFDENRTPGGEDDCHPLRLAAGFFEQWRIECDVANINTSKNGSGATIEGVELGYTQNYDFLPGIWSGFGATINYTYQKSESDPVEIGNSGRFLKPLPQPFTPRHSANATLFYEKDGIQLRLAHRYTGQQLVNRGLSGVSLWQDESHRLDFSASYAINKNLTVTFNALNITDDTRRNFVTAANAINPNNVNSNEIVLDEGSVYEDSSIPQERTASLFKFGRQFRIGLRGTF